MNTDYIIIFLLALLVFQNTSLDKKLGLFLVSIPHLLAKLYRKIVKGSVY